MRFASFIVCLLLLASGVHAQSPAVFDGGVVNAASFAGNLPVTPGSLVSIFGTDLAADLAIADSIPLSTAMLSTRVLFNGIQSPLLFLFPGNEAASAQVNAQVPWNVLGGGGGSSATSGNIQIVVENGGVQSAPLEVPVADHSPGIFTVQFGVGQAIATNAVTGVLAALPSTAPGSQPIQRGQFLTIWCTGLGAVDPAVPTGDIPRDQIVHFTTQKPSVLFGDMEVEGVAAISPQFVGVYQVNVEVPSGAPLGDAVPLKLRIGGLTSRDEVTVAIE